MIKTKGLTKRFGNKVAVDNVCINIPKHSIYCLAGPNGAGKTTILDMLSTLKKPTSGSIWIDNIDISKEPDRVRSIIGVVAQDSGFDPSRTVIDQLNLYSELTGDKSEARRILDLVGLDPKSRIKELSNGKRRLLAIGQALISSPKVLILDEPLEGLDPKTTITIKKILPALKKTIIFTSHNMSQIEEVATHIGLLHNGKLKIESGIRKLIDKKDIMELTMARSDEDTIKSIKMLNSVISLKQEDKKILIQTDGDSMKILPIILNIISRNDSRVHTIRTGTTLEKEFIRITDSQD